MILLVIFLAIANVMMVACVIHQRNIITGFRYPPKAVESRVPKPICICKHGYNYHSKEGCGAMVGKTVDGMVYKTANKCSCVVYTGPEPLPEYYHPGELT